MPRFFFCGLLLVITLSAQSQDYVKKLDSLIALIPNTKGPVLTKTFNRINEYSLLVPRVTAFRKANEAMIEANKSKEVFAHFLALRNISWLHAQYQEQTQALHFMQEGLAYALEKADSFTLGLSYFYTAEFYRSQQLLANALENLLKASTIFEALKDYRYVTECRNIATNIHYQARNFIQAIEEAQLVVKHHQLIPIAERTDEDDFQLMSIYNTLGLCYNQTRQYDKAISHYKLSEDIAKKIKNDFWIGLINGNCATVYNELGLFDKAIQALKLDFNISRKFNQPESAIRAASQIAEIYMEQGDATQAQEYLDSARRLTTGIKRFELVDFWRVEAFIEKQRGDVDAAFVALEKYSKLRDSLYRQSEALNLTKVKANYDLERKQKEIEAFALKDQQHRDRIQLQNIIIAASSIIVLLLLALVLVYILNVRKLKQVNTLIKRQHQEIEYKNEELEAQSQQLKKANELANSLNSQLEQKVNERTHELELTLTELDTFLYRSSHDIRRPLSTLLGLENIARLQTKDPHVLKLFSLVGETVRHMDSMLLKLQMAYELTQHGIEFEKVAVSEIVQDQVAKFQKKNTDGTIELDIPSKKSIPILSNAKLLTIIIKNLLENGIHFRKPEMTGDAHILVQIFYNENDLQLVVTDNGVGIDSVYLPKIFDQYFKGTETSKGNGMGLFLVKKALDKLNGTIDVTSKLGHGSIFKVTLPYTPSH